MTDLAADHGTHAHDDHHPTERQYWWVFALLFVLTAVEVLWSYLGLEGVQLWLPLIIMMVVKFLLVVGAFMHIYFDMKVINGKLFAWTFGGALILAIAVYFVLFAAFDQVA
ncbi:MAG: cytochrome C oxidase subunit IV family protein [Actinomycetota bacterium]